MAEKAWKQSCVEVDSHSIDDCINLLLTVLCCRTLFVFHIPNRTLSNPGKSSIPNQIPKFDEIHAWDHWAYLLLFGQVQFGRQSLIVPLRRRIIHHKLDFCQLIRFRQNDLVVTLQQHSKKSMAVLNLWNCVGVYQLIKDDYNFIGRTRAKWSVDLWSSRPRVLNSDAEEAFSSDGKYISSRKCVTIWDHKRFFNSSSNFPSSIEFNFTSLSKISSFPWMNIITRCYVSYRTVRYARFNDFKS